MSDDFNVDVDILYGKMIDEMVTNLWKERIKTLAQNKVIALKYNEVLAINETLNKELLRTQEQLSHALKERDRLKRNAKKSS